MLQKRKPASRVLIATVLLFIFQQSASAAARFVANALTYDTIDKNGVFAWISVHHIVQMLLALIAVVILAKLLHLDFGFHFGDKKAGLKYTAIFSAAIFIYVLASYFVSCALRIVQPYEYPFTFKNVTGSLGFQLLLSGTSEEILFRALPMTLLVFSLGTSKIIKVWKLRISLETVLAAFLFSLAHVNWTLKPWTVTASWFQLVYAFILGLCYGDAYQKSKSVVYPMAIHGIGNFFAVGVGYVFQALSR